MAQIITASDNELPCLMIPTTGRPMLIPNVSVAEIVNLPDTGHEDWMPDWMLGFITWRDTRIPLISLQVMNGEPASISSESKVAVINSVTGKIPFYAIVVEGIPRLIRVQNDDIEQESEADNESDALNIAINGELAVIPDLEIIENRLLEQNRE